MKKNITVHPKHFQTYANKYIGFTLIEILIALFIFAIIAVIMANVFRTVYDARDHLNIQEQQLTQLQITTALLQHDIRQIINKPNIDTNGNKQDAIIGLFHQISFSCTCNDTNFYKHTDLQRVSYYLQNGNLIRQSYDDVDQNNDTHSITKVLLNNVTNLEINYLDNKNLFAQTWFMENLNNAFPRAILIKIQLRDNGSFNYLIPLAIATTKG